MYKKLSIEKISRLISEDVNDFNGVDSTIYIKNYLTPMDFDAAGVVDYGSEDAVNDLSQDKSNEAVGNYFNTMKNLGGEDAYYLDDLSDNDWFKALQSSNEANDLSYGPVVENIRIIEKEVIPANKYSTMCILSMLIDVNMENFLESMSKGSYACTYDWVMDEFDKGNIKIVKTKTHYDTEKAKARIEEYGRHHNEQRFKNRKK